MGGIVTTRVNRRSSPNESIGIELSIVMPCLNEAEGRPARIDLDAPKQEIGCSVANNSMRRT